MLSNQALGLALPEHPREMLLTHLKTKTKGSPEQKCEQLELTQGLAKPALEWTSSKLRLSKDVSVRPTQFFWLLHLPKQWSHYDLTPRKVDRRERRS